MNLLVSISIKLNGAHKINLSFTEKGWRTSFIITRICLCYRHGNNRNMDRACRYWKFTSGSLPQFMSLYCPLPYP